MVHHPWLRSTLILLVIVVLGGFTIKIMKIVLPQDPASLSPNEMAIADLDKYNLTVELITLLTNQLTFPLREIDIKITSDDQALMTHAGEIRKYLTDQGFVVNGPNVLQGKDKVEYNSAITVVPTNDENKIELIVNGIN